MPLHFEVSNQLEALAASMIQKVLPERDVFLPTSIITQVKGMNQWLVQKIAAAQGIAANIEFYQPSDFIFGLYQLFTDHNSQKLSRNNIDWLIYQALSEKPFKDLFPVQYHYFMENGKVNDVKKWELASKIADLFDQYQVYRHPVIRRWNNQHLSENEKKFEWQYYLWNRIRQIAGEYFPDMTEIHELILLQIRKPEKIQLLRSRFPKISLFGISILTPFHIQIFYALADHIDIHFFLLDPAPGEFWVYDLSEKETMKFRKELLPVTGNPLLTNWGKVIQSTYRMLFRDDALLNIRDEVGIREPERTSLLGKVQNDIFHNRITEIHFAHQDLADESIRVSSAYTIHSEVEALYNYILDIIHQEKIKGIREKDILVIVPQIDKYAPYIKSVFDQAPYRFKYSIADEHIAGGNSWGKALLSLLRIQESSFTVERVLEILESGMVRNKFGLEDVDQIRNVLRQAQIKWGFDNRKEDETFLVSWKYGLRKIMYGICIDGIQFLNDDNGNEWISLDTADTIRPMQEISRFVYFVDLLIEDIRNRNQNRNLAYWQQYLQELIQKFLLIPDEDTEQEVRQFLAQNNQFEYLPGIRLTEEISFDVIAKRLTRDLAHHIQEKNYLNRGITFCSPVPFRSIPFQVIAFMGLHFDAYPRKEKPLDFDLIRDNIQLGDRNIKENDKHLFLESLLSAQQKFYMSYVGTSPRDNTPLPPSILIDELLDYIQAGMENPQDINVRERLIEHKPLHSYSSRYNQPGSRLTPNYLIRRASPYPVSVSQTAQERQTTDTISLQDLYKLGTDSVELYITRGLGIYLKDEDETISRDEVFAMGPPDLYAFKQDLIQAQIHREDMETVKKKWHLQSKLPLKNMKEVITQQAESEIHKIYNRFSATGRQQPEEHIGSLRLPNGKTIEGNLRWLDGNILKDYTFKPEPDTKFKIRMYIRFLFARAVSRAEQAEIHTPYESWTGDYLSAGDAASRLETISGLFNQATSSLYFYSADLDDKMIEESLFTSKVAQKANSSFYYNDYVKLGYKLYDLTCQYPHYEVLYRTFQEPAVSFFKKM